MCDGVAPIASVLSSQRRGLRVAAARCVWMLSRNNANKSALFDAEAVPALVRMLGAEAAAERQPAMAALWNLSLRSAHCEEIRWQMVGCDILPALGKVGQAGEDGATVGLARKLHAYLEQHAATNASAVRAEPAAVMRSKSGSQVAPR